VDVRVLVSRKFDVFFMHWLTSTYYFGLLQAGVKIYEYLPRIYHAKARIVDDWFLVGSSNLNHRSLIHDLEVDIELTRPGNKECLEQEFFKDLKSSEIVTPATLKSMSLFTRLLAEFFRVFRYWL
jgi:cardiolipin synthase A/B